MVTTAGLEPGDPRLKRPLLYRLSYVVMRRRDIIIPAFVFTYLLCVLGFWLRNETFDKIFIHFIIQLKEVHSFCCVVNCYHCAGNCGADSDCDTGNQKAFTFFHQNITPRKPLALAMGRIGALLSFNLYFWFMRQDSCRFVPAASAACNLLRLLPWCRPASVTGSCRRFYVPRCNTQYHSTEPCRKGGSP